MACISSSLLILMFSGLFVLNPGLHSQVHSPVFRVGFPGCPQQFSERIWRLPRLSAVYPPPKLRSQQHSGTDGSLPVMPPLEQCHHLSQALLAMAAGAANTTG
jgi:hypothetical protein